MNQKGYTLIELMMVVAIIGILSTLAVPVYFDYIRQAKVVEASALFSGFKTNLQVMYAMNGIWPSSQELNSAGIVYKGTYVIGEYNDASAAAGMPQVCFKVMGFDVGKDSIGWKYISNPIDPMQKIWSCKASDSGCTTLSNFYLPQSCQ